MDVRRKQIIVTFANGDDWIHQIRHVTKEVRDASVSGGLLIALPREQAAAFCKDIEKQEGYQAWIIGIVEKGNRTARIIDKPRVIEVPAKEKEGELW